MRETASHLCPRRGPGILVEGLPLSDSWVYDPESKLDLCSFCTSVRPEQFLQLVSTGCTLTPTDKDYKCHVDETCMLIRRGDSGQITTPPHQHVFYFAHLSRPEREIFIGMVQRHEIKFGFPGYFYVIPFFMVPPPVIGHEETISGFHEVVPPVKK